MRKILNLFMAVSLFAAVFMISSCRKDIEEVPLVNLLGEAKNLTVKGRVVDEAGNAVAGATVQAGYGSQSTTTDQYGVFMLQAIKGYQKLGYIKVTKSGYLPGSRSFAPVKSGSNIIEIMLLQKNIVGTVSATAGGSVMAEGAKITFPANGFVKNGKAYTGNVKVAANLIDPTSPTLMQEMPGSLVGAMENQAYGLRSFGMIGVELTDDGGNKIDLAPDAKATINFPIPSSILNDAPGTIQLWSFDELSGVWKYEGNAQKMNGQYVAEVGHFSYWNCDVPFEFAELSGIVVDNLGDPISDVSIIAISSQLMGYSSAYTNSAGYYSTVVPKNIPLTISSSISYVSNCSNYQFNIQIISTTFSQDVNQQNFASQTPVPTPVNMTTFSGILVDCNNQPISNGYLVGNNTVYYANTDGSFSFSMCAQPASIIAINLTTSQYSSVFSYNTTSSSINMGNIQVCQTYDSVYVSDIDGNVYPTVLMNGKRWMANNLKVTKFNDGTIIPQYTDSLYWDTLNTIAWKYINNNPAYEVPYGKVYNIYVTQHASKNVCPIGWHVPTYTEYDDLLTFLGGNSIAGGKLKLTGTQFWKSPNQGATNEYGFNGIPNIIYQNQGLLVEYALKNQFAAFKLYYLDASLSAVSNSTTMSVRCVQD